VATTFPAVACSSENSPCSRRKNSLFRTPQGTRDNLLIGLTKPAAKRAESGSGKQNSPLFCLFSRSRHAALPDDGVRQKARGVLGYRACVLAHREAARLAGRDPRAEHRVVAVELRQRRDGLAHEPFAAVGAAVGIDFCAVDDELDVGAFARIERLAAVR